MGQPPVTLAPKVDLRVLLGLNEGVTANPAAPRLPMYIRTGLGTLRALRQRLSRYSFRVADPQPLVAGIEIHAVEGLDAALERLGRCEDLRFSPDGSRLAIPGYRSRTCLVMGVAYDQDGAVAIEDFVELESPGFTQPHGIDFIDNETLVIGNRDDYVTVAKLPDTFQGRRVRVEATSVVTGRRFTRTAWPGSVAVLRAGTGELSVLACNNYVDRISQHFLSPAPGYRETRSRIMFARGLYIPDGVAISADGEWFAISCHGSHSVAIYSASRTGRFAAPVGVLEGPHYPHGLKFTADGRQLLVADAGSPHVHVFERGAGWEGKRTPVRSVQVLDDATYARGRTMPSEGGPKGIDFDPQSRVIAICCEEQRLKFLPYSAVLGASATAPAEANATADAVV